MKMKTGLVAGTALVLVSACTWVKPVAEAEKIGLVKPAVAQHCNKLGVTTVKVKDDLGPISRSEKKVQQELITLAKNDAAVMGGDIIVAESTVSDGRQKFSIYKCPLN